MLNIRWPNVYVQANVKHMFARHRKNSFIHVFNAIYFVRLKYLFCLVYFSNTNIHVHIYIFTHKNPNTCQSFLRNHNESVRKIWEISKFHRHPTFHVKTFTGSNDEPLAAVPPDMYTCFSSTYSKDCCITSQSQDSINSGEWMKYTNSNGVIKFEIS